MKIERGIDTLRRTKWLFTSFIVIFMLTSIVGDPGVLASSLKDMQEEKKVLDEKKNKLNSNIDQKEAEIQKNESQIQTILGKISSLNKDIDETNGDISKVEAEIVKISDEIEVLKLSISELEKKIAERDVVLRERVRTMQVSGGSVNYLDVLLGANSFSDFIDRFSAVALIIEADRNIMKQQAADQKHLEEEKKLVEQRLATQEENKEELNNLKATLELQKQENGRLVDSLEAEQSKLEVEKEHLEHEYHEVIEVSKEVEAEIVAEQKRMAEIARKAAAEKKAREEAARKAQSNNGSSGNLPIISNGSWTTPAGGRFSSSFGWRLHPIEGVQKQHRGVDISNSTGTPIVAAGDGIVSLVRNGFGGYGNVIMITHYIDNQIFTTVYAHLSSIGVSSGQQVTKGQFIGGMGSTGNSTGSHLHFEFHVGGWSGSGPSAVNPLRYVPF